MSRKTKDILMIIVFVSVLVVLFWFIREGRIGLLALPLVLIIGMALVLVFRPDMVKIFLIDVKLFKGFLDVKAGLETFKEAVEPVKDLEISVGDESAVEESKRVDVVLKPKVLKLRTVVKEVEVLVDKAEKYLSGTISGKSDARGNLTKIKKKK